MNILIDTFNTVLNQAIATAIAEAIKPLQERIAVLEGRGSEWTAMEHVAAKAVQPLQDRIVAVEINQSLGRAEQDINNFNESVRNVLDGYDYVKREDIYVAVTTAIDDYDFSDIIQEITSDAVDEDRVQEMIDETLDSCTIRRG